MDLNDFLEDLEEDLQQVEQEEAAVPQAAATTVATVSAPLVITTTSTSTTTQDTSSNKRTKLMMPLQLMRKKEEIVTSAAPTRFTQSSQQLQPPQKQPAARTQPIQQPTQIRKPSPPRPAPTVTNRSDLIFQPAAPVKTVQPSVGTSKTTGEAETKGEQKLYGLFVGNLSPETREEHVQIAFKEYLSIKRFKVVMDRDKCKGYGFAYFADPFEMLRALREKNGKLCGNKPMLLSKAKGEHQDDNKKPSKH